MVSKTYSSGMFVAPQEIRDAYRGKKILLTGGRGFIGSALAQSLATIEGTLILLDRSTANVRVMEHQEAEIVFLKGDVSNRVAWDSALAGVDYIFHLAGQEYIRGPEYNPLLDLQSNALPVLHLLEACREHGYRPTIVFASSANLFGITSSLPINEDQRDNPLIPWAVHKLMAEGYFRSYAHQHGISSVVLRLANVYGPTAKQSALKRVVINGMVAKALAGESLTLYANHNCIRDYVFLTDVVQAFLLAGLYAKSKESTSDMFVIGSGEGQTIAETWQLIADRVGLFTNRNVEVKWDLSVEVGPFEMRNFVADSTRFQSATGWKPQIKMAQGIDLTIEALAAAHSQLELDSRR